MKRDTLCRPAVHQSSRPPRARGLKLVKTHSVGTSFPVAPPAGAWIETEKSNIGIKQGAVAPPAGAWIETLANVFAKSIIPSRPPRARGLKQIDKLGVLVRHSVAPPAGAWIETYLDSKLKTIWRSRPPRARGLKPRKIRAGPSPSQSRPPRARGLKPIGILRGLRKRGRAPRGRVD